MGIEYHIVAEDTYSIVKRVIPEGKTMCGLCSRLRRGILYRVATEFGMNKIALGHHRDDITVYADAREFPIIPCSLCGSQDNLQRRQIKSMLTKWESDNPGRVESIFRSLQNVTPSHLADAELFDFPALGAVERKRVAGWLVNDG